MLFEEEKGLRVLLFLCPVTLSDKCHMHFMTTYTNCGYGFFATIRTSSNEDHNSEG
jgi:hypothetical protein